MKVIIDPRSNYLYGSFYMYGIRLLAGKRNVSYCLSPFKELPDLGNDMRFIVCDKERQTKYYLHLNDSYRIMESDYKWSDVYGCVNANYSQYPRDKYLKLVSLVPSFGIRFEKSLLAVLINSLVLLSMILPCVLKRTEWNKYSQRLECNRIRNLRHYIGRRYRTWKNRMPLEKYVTKVPSEDNYIFFLSTLWYNDVWNKNDEGVNLRRAHFIRACKSIENCQFEGGLLGDASSSNEKFADVYTDQRVAFPVWIEKTKRSALVFNTPAFWDCHGWKLGEYLALGKCIVSTKLSNDLPYPLEHGKNIHFVEDTEESMREAIEYILDHPEYRHKLEQGAKAYWEKYGTPEASLKLLGII